MTELVLGSIEAIGSGLLLLSVLLFFPFYPLLCYHYHFLFHSLYTRGPTEYPSLSLLNTLIGLTVKDVPPSDRANI